MKRKPKAVSRFKQPYISPDGERVMLTDQQHQFAKTALNDSTSEVLINRVMEIYQTDRSNARVIARENFQKPNIIQYLGDRGYRALDILNEAMNDKKASWTDRINASKDLADRQFGKAVQRQQIHQTTVTLELDLSKTVED